MELLFILSSFFIAALISFLVKQRSVMGVASIIAALIAFVASMAVAFRVATFGVYDSLSFFSVDALGAIVMLIIACVGLATTVYSTQYIRQEMDKQIIGPSRTKQYFVLLNLFLAVMFLAVTVSSPVFAWISVEATTLSTAFLISFYNKPSAMEAAWKYLIVNSVGLLLAFFGTLLYFTAVSSLGEYGFVSWQLLMENVTHLSPVLAKIAFIFVLVGYGTKVGFAPMHTWLPDAHSKAPAPVSALLSGVLLNVALVVVLRFKVITDTVVGHSFSQNLLIGFGLLSILIAALIIFTQKNYKRLLAYSSIENMGIMALGFGFGGVGVFAAVLHMIYHAFVKSALFLSAGNIFLKYGSTKIDKVRGVFTALPITSIIFLAGVFAITGTPPFGIFLTKLSILSEGMQSYPFVSAMVLFLMALLFIGFFKHATTMVFGEEPEEMKPGEGSPLLVFPPFVLVTIALYLSFSLPPFLYTLINTVASTY